LSYIHLGVFANNKLSPIITNLMAYVCISPDILFCLAVPEFMIDPVFDELPLFFIISVGTERFANIRCF
jgi:hypothetical protein